MDDVRDAYLILPGDEGVVIDEATRARWATDDDCDLCPECAKQGDSGATVAPSKGT